MDLSSLFNRAFDLHKAEVDMKQTVLDPEAKIKNWTPQLEKQFQNEVLNSKWANEFKNQYGELPNLNSSDYNYRAAYQRGMQPMPDEFDRGRLHWLSSTPQGESLKSFNHPTAWKEDYMRITGVNPDSQEASMLKLTPAQQALLNYVLQKRYGKQ